MEIKKNIHRTKGNISKKRHIYRRKCIRTHHIYKKEHMRKKKAFTDNNRNTCSAHFRCFRWGGTKS
jgi:hypothetical protein